VREADPRYEEQIVLVEGDILSPATATAVRERVAGRDRRFVIEDSAHVYATTHAALDGFAELVPIDGFMVVEGRLRRRQGAAHQRRLAAGRAPGVG
jgi:cephalosporin hydroxylase